jgi:hypothetical protein
VKLAVVDRELQSAEARLADDQGDDRGDQIADERLDER